MAKSRAQVEEEPSSSSLDEGTAQSAAGDESVEDRELVARASLARRRGERNEPEVKALLDRAARRHRAALDRLAR